MELNEKELIRYFKSLGLKVQRTTKARGHQGFFMKNRIDVSKNTPPHRVVPTLLHEFAHYVHSKIEPEIAAGSRVRFGGTFKALFKDENPIIEEELLKITAFVDENSLCQKLYDQKETARCQIKYYEDIIKSKYPKFQRSKKFKEFEKYIKNSKAKYLLKHDRVKVLSGFLGFQTTIYSIDNIERDFADMPSAFAACLRLKSAQRMQSRVSARINRLQKYYNKPSELFARLVESVYIDFEKTREIAPYTGEIFLRLLEEGHYLELANLLEIKKAG